VRFLQGRGFRGRRHLQVPEIPGGTLMSYRNQNLLAGLAVIGVLLLNVLAR
jgi:hypothetical protein